MAEMAFPRHESGLVDFDCYLPYLPDHPDNVPIYVIPSSASPFVHQHVYFKLDEYRSPGKTGAEGELNPLSWFRSFSYNQILMRRDQETRVHQDLVRHVEPPPVAVVEMSIEDFRRLDLAAVASLGLQLTLNPEKAPQNFPDTGLSAIIRRSARLDVADYFDTLRESTIHELASPKVTPHKIITSAFKRLAIYLDDKRLADEANERLADDPEYYPLRVRDKRHFLNMGNCLLKREFQIETTPEETVLDAGIIAA